MADKNFPQDFATIKTESDIVISDPVIMDDGSANYIAELQEFMARGGIRAKNTAALVDAVPAPVVAYDSAVHGGMVLFITLKKVGAVERWTVECTDDGTDVILTPVYQGAAASSGPTFTGAIASGVVTISITAAGTGWSAHVAKIHTDL